MTRRESLALLAGTAACSSAPEPEAEPAAETAEIPIIDTHIHLFDPRRPEGVPWPPADDEVRYKPALPERYREVVADFPVKGAIKVEASPWFDDNQWVLDLAETDPIIVGVVGNLEPGEPPFREQLDRFDQNELFLGIRYGNLWGRSLRDQLGKPAFVDDMRYFASKGLVMDTANPTVDLLEDVVRLSDDAPELRIVVDHLPKIVVAPEEEERFAAVLEEIGSRARIYVKVSAVLAPDATEYDLDRYRPRLDLIFGTFGEDRVLYGSDWPNSDGLAPYPEILHVVRDYFSEKSREVQEKYFWRNSTAAYRWVRRTEDQPAV